MDDRSEQLIILKLQSGDPEAYTELYKKYYKPIYRFVYFRVSNEDVAEDIMQEVFLKFIEVADNQRITNARAYLYKTAKNLVIDFYREQGKVVKVSLEDVGELVSILGQSLTESKIDLEIAHKAIFKLKDQWRDLILLRYVEGLEYEEIAEIFSKSQSYIRVNLHRARKELKKIFEQSHD